MMTVPSIYERLPPGFYDASLRSWNPVTRHYHSSRYSKIRRFVSERFAQGMKILDIGCGSASWNTAKLPVEGVDENQDMLDYGMEKGYLSRALRWDITKTPFPIEAGTFDFVIISEVLEHLHHPEQVLEEAHRLLKEKGLLIVTVPSDAPFSLWSVLFGLNCFLKGDLMGDEYYKNRCGHVQRFSVERLERVLSRKGFRIVEKDLTLLNIAMMAERI